MMIENRENKEIQMFKTFFFFSLQLANTINSLSSVPQARSHTGVHRFTRISQRFQNDSEIQERGLEGVKIQNTCCGALSHPTPPFTRCLASSALIAVYLRSAPPPPLGNESPSIIIPCTVF